MKDKSLRVLIVEDSEDDVLLIIRDLKKGGYNPVYERVETATAMKKSLQEKQWDIILCDYKMPKFDAPSAIAVLKEASIDIPLIVVSGTVGEDVAVECLRIGAQDYIMKDKMIRLCPAIARELKEAEIKNSQRLAESQREDALKSLRESDERYKALFNGSLDLIYITDFEGRFIDANDTALNILGYTREEISCLNFASLLRNDELSVALEALQDIRETGIGTRLMEFRLRRKDGSEIYIETRGSAVMSNGIAVAIQGIARDITERKQAEEALSQSEEKYRDILENMQESYYELDLAGNLTFINNAVCRNMGYSKDELIGMNYRQYTEKEEVERVFRAYSKVYITGKPLDEFGWRITRKDGTKMYIEGSVAPKKDSEGKTIGFKGIHHDVTERKHAEEELRQSEEKYRTILENIEDGYYEVDLKGDITFFNDSMCRIFGYPKEELMGMNNRQYTDKETAKQIFQAFNKVYNTGEPVKEFDWQIIRKDGAQRCAEASASLIKDSSGKPIGFRGIIRDVTERKIAESQSEAALEALRQNEEKYRTILENIEDGYYETDLAGRYTFFNDSMCRIHGYPMEELMGMNKRQYTDKEYSEKLFKTFNEVYKTGQPAKGFGWQIIRKDGTKRYIEASVSLTKDLSGKPIGFRGITRDITERKKAEESLLYIKKAVESSSDAIGIADPQAHHFYLNKSFIELFEYTPEELEVAGGIPVIFVDEHLAHEIINVLMNGNSWSGELEGISKSGHKFPVALRADAIKDESGKIVGLIGVHTDITERKQAEEKLLESEGRLRGIAKNLPGIVIYQFYAMDSGEYEMNYASERMHDFFGLTTERKEDMFTVLLSHIHEEDRDEFLASIQKAVKTGTIWNYTGRIAIMSGEIIWFQGIATPTRQENKLVFDGILMNITDRKQTESQKEVALEALRQSEEKYRSILENMQEGYFEVDLAGNFTFFNDAMCRLYGYSREKLMGMNHRQYADKETAKKLFQKFNQVYNTGKTIKDFNWQAIRKDGTKKYVEASVSLTKDSSGKPIGFKGIVHDITERKQAEQGLQESEKYFKEITENSSDIIVITDKNGDIKYCSRSVERFTGYKPEELIGRNGFVLVHPDDIKRAGNDYQKAILSADSAIPNSFHIVRKDGSERYFEGLGRNLLDNPAVEGFIMNVRDVTEVKQADAELKRTLDNLRKSFGTTIQVMVSAVEMRDPYTAGHQLRVADIARAIATEMGLPRDQIDGIRLAGSIHDIGKLSIPAEILSKPTKLTAIEFSLIKEHSRIGYEMLKDMETPWPLAQIVYQHHERMNGSGYPRNLKGDEIIIEARIMAVADVVEAMASHRPYRPGLGIDAALEEIEKNKGIIYDHAVADTCLRLFREKGYQLK